VSRSNFRDLHAAWEDGSRFRAGSVQCSVTSRRDNAMDPDAQTRAAIEEHWRASERGDTETEHAI